MDLRDQRVCLERGSISARQILHLVNIAFEYGGKKKTENMMVSFSRGNCLVVKGRVPLFIFYHVLRSFDMFKSHDEGWNNIKITFGEFSHLLFVHSGPNQLVS